MRWVNNYSAWVEINLDNIIFNMQKLRGKVGPDIKIMAIVKANGYGHGLCEIGHTVLESGADFLGVATIYEAIKLRQSGIKVKIFLTNAVLPEQIDEIIKWDITPFVYDIKLVKALDAELKKASKKISVHVKIDTGMGRLGLAPENFLDFITELQSLKNLNFEGVLTHFAQSDDEEYTDFQLERFNVIINKAYKRGITFTYIHCANSAALLRCPDTYFNIVRPGISIYGLYPCVKLQNKIELRPAMKVKAKIIFVKNVPIGTSISYGRTFLTSRPSVIATIPVGYADGYSRILSNKGEVIVSKRRVRVVGTVCMDSFMIDVTEVPDIKTGDEVTLLGREGDEEISAEELAMKTGTINYEIVSNIGDRLPRVYLKSQEVVKEEYL
ncbi:alanine racemase [Candidatus Desantisbacteria bacterium]|nr:alanine racemase [Candidatus Desantisbacteria bacterium]